MKAVQRQLQARPLQPVIYVESPLQLAKDINIPFQPAKDSNLQLVQDITLSCG